jgi:hypothetical protein
MSNYLAVATVTATLRRSLQAAIDTEEVVPGAKVGTGRPEGTENGTPRAGVNIFLYQVTPNAAWRNTDLPTRDVDGSLRRRPQVALDLHYLLTFYGDESTLQPQLLLGSVVRTLHARPVLTRKMVEDTLADPLFGFLRESNLADSVELVKFTPSSLSLEDLSKLWSVFFQTPYALSVAYQGTVVLIESEAEPHTALPVRTRNVYAVAFRQPTIERIMSRADDDEPILADQPILARYTLVLAGKHLRGELTRVRIDEEEIEPEEIEDEQISVPLPRDLRSGVHRVQVVQYAQMGTPPTPHRAFESNVVSFVLCPKITASVTSVQGTGDEPRSADIRVNFDPEVGRSQRVVLMLDEYRPPSNRAAHAYSFTVPPREETDETDVIHVRVTDVRPGTYLVRVQVDGARSPLRFNSQLDRYDLPRVTIR